MKDNRVYLIHIRDCIQRIETYTVEGKAAFFADLKTQDAVIRNLQTYVSQPNDCQMRGKQSAPKLTGAQLAIFATS